MLFNSLTFFIFLPIVFIIYWHFLNKNLKYQNLFLLISSYFFYAWWDYRFLSLIIISTIVDFISGSKIYHSKNKDEKLLYLCLSLTTNLLILGIFKYYNFFVSSFYDLIGIFGFDTNYESLKIILPVGISFYTFQTLSYSIDIFRNQIKPTKDIISFAAFVSFFPQLVAGPIERAKNLLPQIEKKRAFNKFYTFVGIRLIIWGMFKKIVVADNLAIYVDLFYASHNSFDFFGTITAMFFFTFQIYCDFSGYSDIAIGIARLFGIKLNRNFKIPYSSKSFSEFWQRWHISLSSWFRDYVYISLGGNRLSKILNFRNLIITFCVSGLWHGANYNFIIWGLIHSLLLILERSFSYKPISIKINQYLKVLIVFIITNYTWVIFRTTDLKQAYEVILNSFNFFNYNSLKSLELTGTYLSQNGFMMNDIIFMFLTISFVMLIELYDKKFQENSLIKSDIFQYIYLQILIIACLSSTTTNVNFIYFQF